MGGKKAGRHCTWCEWKEGLSCLIEKGKPLHWEDTLEVHLWLCPAVSWKIEGKVGGETWCRWAASLMCPWKILWWTGDNISSQLQCLCVSVYWGVVEKSGHCASEPVRLLASIFDLGSLWFTCLLDRHNDCRPVFFHQLRLTVDWSNISVIVHRESICSIKYGSKLMVMAFFKHFMCQTQGPRASEELFT